MVAVRWTLRGTHEGSFLGIAPTGRAVTYTGISIFRLSCGKIVERWNKADALGLLQQLGAREMPRATPIAAPAP